MPPMIFLNNVNFIDNNTFSRDFQLISGTYTNNFIVCAPLFVQNELLVRNKMLTDLFVFTCNKHELIYLCASGFQIFIAAITKIWQKDAWIWTNNRVLHNYRLWCAGQQLSRLYSSHEVSPRWSLDSGQDWSETKLQRNLKRLMWSEKVSNSVN